MPALCEFTASPNDQHRYHQYSKVSNPTQFFSDPTKPRERGLLTMKRLATGLPKPCSTTRRISTIEDSVGFSHSRQQLGHQPRHPHTQQQIRNASSKVSRPRTALFFPGMSTLDFMLNDSPFSAVSNRLKQVKESRRSACSHHGSKHSQQPQNH